MAERYSFRRIAFWHSSGIEIATEPLNETNWNWHTCCLISNLEFTFPISLMLRAQPAKDEQGAAVWKTAALLNLARNIFTMVRAAARSESGMVGGGKVLSGDGSLLRDKSETFCFN